ESTNQADHRRGNMRLACNIGTEAANSNRPARLPAGVTGAQNHASTDLARAEIAQKGRLYILFAELFKVRWELVPLFANRVLLGANRVRPPSEASSTFLGSHFTFYEASF